MERIIFYILAAIIIFFAIASVSSKKMLRAVIYLLFVLIAISGIYFMVDYSFLGAIQLAVYAGGVIVLIIFSVLLVHHIELNLEIASIKKRVIAGLISLAGVAVVLPVILSHKFNVVENSNTIEVRQIGEKMLSYDKGGFILPFEVISILLLAVMIGAIVIAKGNKLEK
jgi:NADH-quinone oxidoreductase subunit J